jgi:phosphoglycerate dehydrogenase-like enzyme
MCPMRVLFVPRPGNEEPWRADLANELGGEASLSSLDGSRPLDGQFAGVDVVVDQGGHGTPMMIDAAARAGVRLWQVLGTGLDHTEVDRILARGMRLANTPGASSGVALAEHALFLMLCLAKRLHASERNARCGRLHDPMTDEIAGQTLGLVGLGASGRELARRAAALGMTVIAVDAAEVDAAAAGSVGVAWCGRPADLPRLLAEADYVSLHVPLTPQTRHLIDAGRLALMKPTAALVNVARGGIVDEGALAAALREGRLRAAGVDVFTEEPPDPANPLLHLDNVVATPHVAGMTYGTSRRRAAACAENVRRLRAGLAPLHEVIRA